MLYKQTQIYGHKCFTFKKKLLREHKGWNISYDVKYISMSHFRFSINWGRIDAVINLRMENVKPKDLQRKITSSLWSMGKWMIKTESLVDEGRQSVL